MTIKEIDAKSILRKHKKIDSWFLSRYGMNLYRGCTHNCGYCDGRAEGYYVEGEFGTEVTVKKNAIAVLRRELDPKRKRVPLKRGFMMVGGGVGDSYQPVEKKYQLTRQALELMARHNLPVHMLTKSTLIERDLELLKKINHQTRAIISFSFSSVDDSICRIFEPGVPPASERLHLLKRFKAEGFACGMYLLPVIPMITDRPEQIEQSLAAAKEAGIDFVCFGGLTLKDGRQKAYFSEVLKASFPKLWPEYQALYPGDRWGRAQSGYYQHSQKLFHDLAKKYRMPPRIPLPVFQNFLDENDLIVVILEHIDYFTQAEGQRSSIGSAAYVLSQLKTPIATSKAELGRMKGLNALTQTVVSELLATGSAKLYQKMIRTFNPDF